LGRRTAAYFEKLGWQVFAPGHSQLDITDAAAVREWFAANRPDAMIHTAAVSDTGECQRNPERSEIINVTGTANLVECCREFGVKPVICSSDQVYFGSKVPGPHREEELLTPSNVYGGQKLRAEQCCLEINPDTVCLRLSWMYSTESYPGEHGHFLTTLKTALTREDAPLAWPVHDFRGLTDARYVVENLPKALELPGGVWNFGSENSENTYETVKTLLQKLGRTTALSRLMPNEEAFAEDPRDITMDLTKLNAAGITFPTTQEGLLQAMAKEETL
jgi:dTDP-4-dehydrorhamnose reductase